MSNNVKSHQGASLRAKGVRAKLRRNRKVTYPHGSVITDSVGNIIDRPITRGLTCFGDPIEHLFGRFDEPRRWGDGEPEANGCAMCQVQTHCYQVVWERLENTPRIRDLYYAWERATCTLPQGDRFSHSTWTAFAVSCEQAGWTDANDRKLEQLEETRIAEVLRKSSVKAAARRRMKRNPRKVPKGIQKQIQEYRDARVLEMVAAKQGAKPPLWIRNRSLERCILVADAWQAQEMLDRENRKSSASAVHEWLIKEGRLELDGPSAMVKRIGEALRRIEELFADDTWPFFDPDSRSAVAPPGSGMHPSTVHTLIED